MLFVEHDAAFVRRAATGRLCCKQAPHHRKEGIFMELTIRADVSAHMRELKQWLAQTRDEPAEDMNGFFAARVDTYEAHMSVWDKAYGRVGRADARRLRPPAGPRLRHRAGAGPASLPAGRSLPSREWTCARPGWKSCVRSMPGGGLSCGARIIWRWTWARSNTARSFP